MTSAVDKLEFVASVVVVTVLSQLTVGLHHPVTRAVLTP